MTSLVLPGSRLGFALRPDGRLLALPVRAAAAGAGRRAGPVLLPERPGRVVAAGTRERWTWVVSRVGAELQAACFRPRGALECELRFEAAGAPADPPLGAVVALGPGPEALLVEEGAKLWRLSLVEGVGAEALGEGLLAFAATREGGAEWLERPAGGAARLARVLAGEPFRAPVLEAVADEPARAVAGVSGPRDPAGRGRFAWRLPDGSWRLAGASRLEGPAEGARVVAACPSPARGGAPGLVLRDERELSFWGPGTRRTTEAGPGGEAWAACPVAPWLLERSGTVVTLRELGRRWGRRLARWQLVD